MHMAPFLVRDGLSHQGFRRLVLRQTHISLETMPYAHHLQFSEQPLLWVVQQVGSTGLTSVKKGQLKSTKYMYSLVMYKMFLGAFHSVHIASKTL